MGTPGARKSGAENRSSSGSPTSTEEEKMTAAPPCPQPQNFNILTGFLTPGSDTGPGALDGSISVDVLDPTEGNERVRAVEVTDPWSLEVDWCICGRFADLICGCWCVQAFIDDIAGGGATSGLLGSATGFVA